MYTNGERKIINVQQKYRQIVEYFLLPVCKRISKINLQKNTHTKRKINRPKESG